MRYQLGYRRIPQRLVTEVNDFCQDYLNPYINFHRPCNCPESVSDPKGEIRKRYLRDLIKTNTVRKAEIDS